MRALLDALPALIAIGGLVVAAIVMGYDRDRQ